MKSFQRSRYAAAALALTSALAMAHPQHAAHAADVPAVAKVAQTNAVLRDLWLGHAAWVRNVALATFAGNTAAAAAAEAQVVTNAKQIAASIEPFYGKAASDKLLGLLVGHYGAVKDYLGASATGNAAKADAAVRALTDNAGEIAVFLSGANPNLPRDAVRSLLLAHGGHHIQQIQQLHDKQYAQEAQTWEAMKAHMYVIADTLAGALAQQFPEKFG
jgi:hypothetical protein